MNLVFICSPYRGNIEANTKVAKQIGYQASVCGYAPVIPHLMYPQFLDDNDPAQRVRGLMMGRELLAKCDMLWIIGGRITQGMRYEINNAKKLFIPIRLYDSQGCRILKEAIEIDDRVSDELREILEGAILD